MPSDNLLNEAFVASWPSLGLISVKDDTLALISFFAMNICLN